MTLSFYIYSN